MNIPKQPKWKDVGARDWGDKPLVIVGAGPSLKQFDFKLLNNSLIRVLAVKNAIFDVPFAEVCFGVDAPWLWKSFQQLLMQPAAVVVSFPIMDNPFYPAYDFATYIPRADHHKGLSENPAMINCSGCSGSSAFNYATLKGAKDILLLGFDYKHDGEHHHYNNARYPRFASYNMRMWPRWASWFRTVVDPCKRLGITVANGSDKSLVDAFPLVDPLVWLVERGVVKAEEAA